MNRELFNQDRFGLLFRRQVNLYMKSWIIALIAISGSLIFISLLLMTASSGQVWFETFKTLGVIAFFITGLIFTSNSFSEMGTYSRSLQYITLPATHFEKFAVGWFMSSVIYILFSVVALVFASAFAGLLSLLLFKGEFVVFNPFVTKGAEVILAYFIAHSAFFLGAAWFRRAAFFKTLLVMIIFNTTINILFVIMAFVIFKPFEMLSDAQSFYMPFDAFTKLEPIVRNSVFVYFSLLAIVFTITAWVRFKEREV